MSSTPLDEARARFAALTRAAPAPEPARESVREVEVVALPTVTAPARRRLNLEMLRAAARRRGLRDEFAAVRAASEITRSGAMARAAAAVILDGKPPGAMTRATIAAFFDVDERELWPAT